MESNAQVLTDTEETYPESDGKPMADNTLQFSWIVLIKEGLEALFADRPDVFVAGDLLWYPLDSKEVGARAPDAMVVFGRPKGHRGSYVQAREEGIGPQVVFEVLSPNNTEPEMLDKLEFYERHAVEEYYVWDPDEGQLRGWLRKAERLIPVFHMGGHVSPRLGVRFELKDGQLELYAPDGSRFLSYVELKQRAEQERQRAELAEQLQAQERQRAELAEQLQAQERQRAELAEQLQAQERQRVELAEQQAARLAERLRALGQDPDAAD